MATGKRSAAAMTVRMATDKRSAAAVARALVLLLAASTCQGYLVRPDDMLDATADLASSRDGGERNTTTQDGWQGKQIRFLHVPKAAGTAFASSIVAYACPSEPQRENLGCSIPVYDLTHTATIGGELLPPLLKLLLFHLDDVGAGAPEGPSRLSHFLCPTFDVALSDPSALD